MRLVLFTFSTIDFLMRNKQALFIPNVKIFMYEHPELLQNIWRKLNNLITSRKKAKHTLFKPKESVRLIYVQLATAAVHFNINNPTQIKRLLC